MTKQQRAELRRLSTGPQLSRGKGLVRVHNNLRALGLVEIYVGAYGLTASLTPLGRAKAQEALTAQ